MALKDNIKKKRQENNMTLEEVALKVGVTRQTIQKYESGVVSNIPSDKIELLAKALDTTPAYLMGWSKNNNSSEEYLLPDEKNLLSNYRLLPLPEKDGACAYMERLAKPYKENSEKASEAPAEGDSYLRGVYGQAAAFGGDSARIPVSEENLKELLRRSAKEDKKEL